MGEEVRERWSWCGGRGHGHVLMMCDTRTRRDYQKVHVPDHDYLLDNGACMAWKSGHVQQPLLQGDGQSIHLASPLGPWLLEVQQAKYKIKPHVPRSHITIVYTGNECSVHVVI